MGPALDCGGGGKLLTALSTAARMRRLRSTAANTTARSVVLPGLAILGDLLGALPVTSDRARTLDKALRHVRFHHNP
jgi:hypothetical protein